MMKIRILKYINNDQYVEFRVLSKKDESRMQAAEVTALI
jgi:hypothetical protein